MRLIEKILEKPIKEETDRNKLPEGVLFRLTYPICNINQRNANKRVYEKAVWDKVLSNKDILEKMEKRALFGHAEHPDKTQSDLQLTSHVIHRMWIDEKENKVYQTIDIVDTPCGRIVDALLRADCLVGVSTRAEGDIQEAEDEDGKYHRVIPESYNYVTTDFTADPSTFGVIPLDSKRNVVSTIKQESMNEKAKKEEKDFAKELLESLKCRKGKKTSPFLSGTKCQNCGCCEGKKVDEGLVKAIITPETGEVRVFGDVTAVDIGPEKAQTVNISVVTSEPKPIITPEPPPTQAAVVGKPEILTPDEIKAKLTADQTEEKPEAYEEEEEECHLDKEGELPEKVIRKDNPFKEGDKVKLVRNVVGGDVRIHRTAYAGLNIFSGDDLKIYKTGSIGTVVGVSEKASPYVRVKFDEDGYEMILNSHLDIDYVNQSGDRPHLDKEGELPENKEEELELEEDKNKIPTKLEKKYWCEVCNKQFDDPKHIPAENVWVCPFCNAAEYYTEEELKNLEETVKKESDGWHVYSKKGKHLGGPYKTKKKADARLAEVEKFKHMKKESITNEAWETLPKGWTKDSLDKFAKSLTDKTKGSPEGFVTACMKEMEGKVDNPGAFCASLKDKYLGTTKWRGKESVVNEDETPKEDITDEEMRKFLVQADKAPKMTDEQHSEMLQVASDLVMKLGTNYTETKEWKEALIRILGPNYMDYFPWKRAEAKESKSLKEFELKQGEIFTHQGRKHEIVGIDSDQVVTECHDEPFDGRVTWNRKTLKTMLENPSDFEIEEKKVDEVIYTSSQMNIPQLAGYIADSINIRPDDTKVDYLSQIRQAIDDYERIYKLKIVVKDKFQEESKSISTISKELTEMKIKEASTRAEKDKAFEVLEELEKTDSNKLLEMKILIKKVQEAKATDEEVEALRIMLEEKTKLASKFQKELTKIKESLSKDMNSLKENIVTKETEIKQLTKKYEKEEKEHKDLVTNSIKEAEQKGVKEGIKQVIKEYVDNKLANLEFSVGENTQALLEDCCSLEEVDNTLEKIRDVRRRSALHSESIQGIAIEPHKVVNKEKEVIDTAVKSAYKGMGNR